MDIWDEVRAERERAHAKHGETSMESAGAHDPTGRRLRILVEEVGEVAKEFNDADHDQRPVDLALLRKELIQVSAMAGAWADRCTSDRLPGDPDVRILLRVAAALGRALHSDDAEFWEVIVQLDKEFPFIGWHNVMTDSGSLTKPA
jgi:hypothetical protein